MNRLEGSRQAQHQWPLLLVFMTAQQDSTQGHWPWSQSVYRLLPNLQAGPWSARPTVMLSAISAGSWACEARVSRVEGNCRLEMGSLDTGNVVMGLRVQSRVTPPVSWALPVKATGVYGKRRELNSTQPTEQPHHYPDRPMARSLLMCRAAEMVGHINKHQPLLRIRARVSEFPVQPLLARLHSRP